MSKNWYGWKGSILRVDLSKKKVSTQELPREYIRDFLGCRGINAKIMFDELQAGIDPRSPENVLVFGTGPLEGTPVGMGRISVSTKSYRRTYAEGGFGGFFAPELKFAGYDHIIFQGRARTPVYLWIHDEHIEVRDALHLWGKTTWETDEIIKRELGDGNIQIISIGPAGENIVRGACIIQNKGRAFGRCGLGARQYLT